MSKQRPHAPFQNCWHSIFFPLCKISALMEIDSCHLQRSWNWPRNGKSAFKILCAISIVRSYVSFPTQPGLDFSKISKSKVNHKLKTKSKLRLRYLQKFQPLIICILVTNVCYTGFMDDKKKKTCLQFNKTELSYIIDMFYCCGRNYIFCLGQQHST